MRAARRGLLAAAIGLVAVLVVGLSVSSARPNATVTLRLLMPTTAQSAQDIIDANFERVYPDIKIEVQYLPTQTLGTILQTQLQAGNAPDVFYVDPGNRVIGVWTLANAGRLLDLTGRKWQRRVYAPTKPLISWKGKVYAWPMAVTPYAVLYNVDLVKQLRLKLPTRFSEVPALCRQITAAGKVPFVEAFGAAAGGSIVGGVMASQFVYGVDPGWDAKRANKQVNFAGSPLWHRALQAIVDMKDAGCFQPAAQGTSRPQQYALFANGDAVMTIAVGGEVPNILAINPNIHYAMTTFPADNPKNTTLLASGAIAIAANATTRYPDAAKTFIDFIAREQQSTLYAKVSGQIAPLDLKKGKLADFMKAGLGPVVKAGRMVDRGYFGWQNTALVYDTAYVNGILGLFTGQTTIDSTLSNMDKAWDTTP